MPTVNNERRFFAMQNTMDLSIDSSAEENYYEQILDDLLSISDTPTEESSNDALELKEKAPFQKEVIFNKLLPYADELDNEADALLAKIKANLGRCVMLREIKPGCVIWSNMLHK